MIKSTLDTNVIVSSFTEEKACVKRVDSLLSKNEPSSENDFLTPAVINEVDKLFTGFLQVIYNVKMIMERKKQSFTDSYREYETTVDDGPGGSLSNKFGNLINFVKKCESRGLAIKTIIETFKQRISRFHRPDISVQPSCDTVREKYTELSALKENIEKKKIGKGNDTIIIAQLILLHQITGNDIYFYTQNRSDFDTMSSGWKELCPFISVFSP